MYPFREGLKKKGGIFHTWVMCVRFDNYFTVHQVCQGASDVNVHTLCILN